MENEKVIKSKIKFFIFLFNCMSSKSLPTIFMITKIDFKTHQN